MKKNLLLSAVLFLSIFYACNNAEKKEETAVATTETTTPAETKPAAEPPYDPDPTDTIPGDQYGSNSSSKQTADLVRLSLLDFHKEDLEKSIIDSFGRRFIFFEYDLNEDGKKEIFVGLRGSYFCGSGGCTTYLLDNQGNIITKFSVSRDS